MRIRLWDIPFHTCLATQKQTRAFLHASVSGFSTQISGWPLIFSLNCSPSFSAAFRHISMRPMKISK